MKLDRDKLVQAYLNPAGDLFWFKAPYLMNPKNDRMEEPYPVSKLPPEDHNSESKLPGPTTQDLSKSRRPPDKTQPREIETPLPLPSLHPVQRDQHIPRFEYNTPRDQPDPRSRTKTDVPVRTLGIPGEEWGNPSKDDYGTLRRRFFPNNYTAQFPKQRQRKQRMKAKRRSARWYQKNKRRQVRRSLRRYMRIKNRASFQRTNRLRKKFPRRFERRPGGYRDPAQRSREWRDKQKLREKMKLANELIEFFYGDELRDALVTGFDPEQGIVEIEVYASSMTDDEPFGPSEGMSLSPMEFWNSATFAEEKDIYRIADILSDLYGIEVWENDEDKQADYPANTPSNLYTQVHIETAPDKLTPTEDQRKDEGKGTPHGPKEHKDYPDGTRTWPPQMTHAPYRRERPDKKVTLPQTMDFITPVRDNPGSARVIPENADYAQNKDFSLKTADTISQILLRTAPIVKRRSKDRPAKIIGHDKQRNLWFFRSGKWLQRLRAVPREGSKARNVTQMDVLVACNCPFFRWQGPEHWALVNYYLYDRRHLKGTASFPEIRDPRFRHAACKHLVAVMNLVRSKKLKISSKKASELDSALLAMRYLLDRGAPVKVEPFLDVDAVLRRYGEM